MRFRLDGRTRAGRAVDLRGTDTTPDAVREALDLDPDDPLATVTEAPPSLVRSLARAGRSRGLEAPQDDRIAHLRVTLAEREPTESAGSLRSGDPTDPVRPADPADPVETVETVERDVAIDLAAARRRAAEAAADVDRLRERVATARGRLQAARESGDDGLDERVEAHATATRELTAAETGRVAAEQALAAATERARERRAERRETLRLRDELANREREARRSLAERVYPEFAATVDGLPGEARPRGGPGEYTGDRVTAHLAAVALADREAPVVLAVDRFDGPTAAAARLETPVVQL